MIGSSPEVELEVGLERREFVRPPESYWRQSWVRLRENRLALAAGAVVLFLAAVAIAAPLIQIPVHYGALQQDLTDNFAPPFKAPHWLGTDELGRDVLIRLVYGARVSLGIGFLTVLIATTVGTAVGLAAGYYGRWTDEVLMRIVDVFLAFPAIFLFIGMSILFRPGTLTLSLIIASVGWAGVARLVRGETLTLKTRDYMLATRSLGARDLRLMVRHLLPNVLPILIVSATLGVGQIILIEAALDFLGLGIQPPTPSWGSMLSNAQTYFYHSPWLVIFPGFMIFVTVLAATLFGNAVRDAFDPRLR
jgi:peptide/nickel transport system permease protein